MPVRATPLHLFRIRHESFDGTIALRSDLRSSPDTRRVGFGECRVHDPCHVPTPRCSTAPAVRGRKAPTGDGRDGPPKRQRSGHLLTRTPLRNAKSQTPQRTGTPAGRLTCATLPRACMSARCAWLHSVPDPRWDERPLACVVPRPGARPSADALKVFLAERVARWWVPERWSFIDEVPKTSVGKFDKKLLRARYADGART